MCLVSFISPVGFDLAGQRDGSAHFEHDDDVQDQDDDISDKKHNQDVDKQTGEY